MTWDGLVESRDPRAKTMGSGITTGRPKIASFSTYDNSLLTISEHGEIHVWDPTGTASRISLDSVPLGDLGYVRVEWLPPSGSYVIVFKKWGHGCT